MPQKVDIRKKQKIDFWEVGESLGSGGQGQVWKVRNWKEKHSTPGALKVCTDPSTKAKKRFLQEVEILKSFSHVGIVRVLSEGTIEDQPYFVMERATTTFHDVMLGRTTGTRLLSESREILIQLVRQACEGLAHMHESDVLHRDLKPRNILVMLDPPQHIRAVLADLGIASRASSQGQLTGEGETIGSPAFRAPEAILEPHSKRSDVYSMGKTIECIFARREYPTAIGPKLCPRDPSMSTAMWNAIDRVVERACAVLPEDRYESAVELLQDMPHPVITTTEGFAQTSSSPPPIGLEDPELVMLATIIAECPLGETVSLDSIHATARISKFLASSALQRLDTLALIEFSIESQGYGGVKVVKPTAQGHAWAHDNRNKIETAIEALPPVSNSDEIPF